MNLLQPNRLVLAGGTVIVLGSFLAMAATSNGLYVALSHMPPLFYLLPILGLLGLAAGLLKPTNRINLPMTCMCVGGLALLLSLYTGVQAKNQLNSAVLMSHEMDVRHSQFESEFNARRDEFARNFTNQGQGTQDPITSEQKALPAATEPVKPTAIAEPDMAGFGVGFYLAILGSAAVIFGGRLMKKQSPESAKAGSV